MNKFIEISGKIINLTFFPNFLMFFFVKLYSNRGSELVDFTGRYKTLIRRWIWCCGLFRQQFCSHARFVRWSERTEVRVARKFTSFFRNDQKIYWLITKSINRRITGKPWRISRAALNPAVCFWSTTGITITSWRLATRHQNAFITM